MTRVVFINCFDVPLGGDAEFLDLWNQVNSYAQTKPGYISHALHRLLQQRVEHNRYINVAQWESEEQFKAANDDYFRELISQPAWARFPSSPGLYEVVDNSDGGGVR